MGSMLDLLLGKELPSAEEKQYRVRRLSDAFGEDFILTLRAISYSRVAEIQKLHHDDAETDIYIVLAGVKDAPFKDSALLEKLGAVTPVEAVKKIFSAGEINDISRKIQLLSGYLRDTLEEVKKN